MTIRANITIGLLKSGRKIAVGDAAIKKAITLLKNGTILAIKDTSGFHIACDALNSAAIYKLRARKKQPYQALAVMAAEAAVIKEFCEFSKREEQLLFSPERPIVLLRNCLTRRLPFYLRIIIISASWPPILRCMTFFLRICAYACWW
jgi:hydrogenase maturation factor HypF (carbamoyltransferase family)